jgi:HK97 family phage portal protein
VSATLMVMWGRLSTWGRRTLAGFRAALISISDPTIGRLFGYRPSYAGVEVTEATAMGLSAVYRGVDLITGTLAQLPMPTLREIGPRHYQRMKSFLDDPGKFIGLNVFVWKRIVFAHLCLYNETFLKHIYGGAGQLLGLEPVHPLSVAVTWAQASDNPQPKGRKWFDVTMIDGTRERHDARTLTHAMGLTLDGLRGLWITSVGRDSLGTAIAGDRSAATMFKTGASISALVTPTDDGDWNDAAAIKAQINDTMTGWDNAGGVAVINRRLQVQPLSLSAVDAQFLESRMFSIEEVARWLGVPPFELMQTDKQTSWGTGVESQQRGLGRQTLAPKAVCLEAALSGLLSDALFVRIDFADLERPAPDKVADQALTQYEAGAITLNEARTRMGYDPIPGGDALKSDVSRETPAPVGAPDA